MEYLSTKAFAKPTPLSGKISHEPFKKKFVNVTPTVYPAKLDDASILNVIIDVSMLQRSGFLLTMADKFSYSPT
jgi:hypothetical protein